MKKALLFVLAAAFAFAFSANQTYSCQTLGISFKDQKGKVVNIPNTAKTQPKMKKLLKSLYTVKIKQLSDSVVVYVGKQNETLSFFKQMKNKIKIYKSKGGNDFLLEDDKHSQIGLSIPAKKVIIYYQCK